MRRVVLLMAVAVLGVAGVAYAASNLYVVKARITPVKSGTLAHPKPIGARIEIDVSTTPPGLRPIVVFNYSILISGVHENTNSFPTCSSSTLQSKSQRGCPRGSKAGSGFLLVEVGPTGNNAAAYSATCRVDVDVFNSGHGHLTLYAFTRREVNACPLLKPIAINLTLRTKRKNLTASFSVPVALRHFPNGADDAITQAVLNLPVHRRTLTVKGVRRTVGLLASVACPVNHQRQVTITFTQEDGAKRTATANTPCR